MNTYLTSKAPRLGLVALASLSFAGSPAKVCADEVVRGSLSPDFSRTVDPDSIKYLGTSALTQASWAVNAPDAVGLRLGVTVASRLNNQPGLNLVSQSVLMVAVSNVAAGEPAPVFNPANYHFRLAIGYDSGTRGPPDQILQPVSGTVAALAHGNLADALSVKPANEPQSAISGITVVDRSKDLSLSTTPYMRAQIADGNMHIFQITANFPPTNVNTTNLDARFFSGVTVYQTGGGSPDWDFKVAYRELILGILPILSRIATTRVQTLIL